MKNKKFLISIAELLLSIIAITFSFVGFIDFRLLVTGVMMLIISGVSVHSFFHQSDSQENIERKNDSLDTKIESKAFIIIQCVNVAIVLISIIAYYLNREEFFIILLIFSSVHLIFMFILEIILAFIYSKNNV